MNCAFWLACYRNHTDHAMVLADQVDVNFELYGLSPLFTAVVHSNLPLIQKLLTCGASDNSVLYMALKIGNAEIIHLLLDKGLFYDTVGLPVAPEIREKIETIELFKCWAAMQRVDLITAQLCAGRSAPLLQWLPAFNEHSFTKFSRFLVLAHGAEAACFAAFFFKESAAPLRRYTQTGSPVSELLVRYLVLPKGGRRALRALRAYLE